MSDKKDFRPYVPTLDYPRVAAFQGRDAYQHGDAGLANPLPQELLFKPWEQLYSKPFKGITTDSQVIEGLYELQSQGLNNGPILLAAQHLLANLSEEDLKKLRFPIDAREWRRWNNTEMYVYRYGLRLEELREGDRQLILTLIEHCLSQEGFQQTRDVMRVNHFLGELTGNTKVLGEWSYNFTLFGEPSLTEPWGWQIMGHHLALNCLIIKDQMSLTPTFMGAEPNHIDEGPNQGVILFEDEENKGLRLMCSLNDDQKTKAIVYHSNFGGDLPPERRHKADQLHLGGAMQDNRIIPYEGIAGKELTPTQRTDLLELIELFVKPLPSGPKRFRMQDIAAHLDETYFSWIGGHSEDDTFYYRIQSPVIMIEFDHHSGVFLTNEKPARFHIHTLVRSPNGGDYGADLLKLHYARDHDHKLVPGVKGHSIDHHHHPHDHTHED
jgi:hypothetical protein